MMLLTQTTDYAASWDNIVDGKTNGEISEAIECIFNGFEPRMDAMICEVVLAVKDGYLNTLKQRLVEHFRDDEKLEKEFDFYSPDDLTERD